ncbi:MAG: prolyl oligopeptidase family serine peptidase [Usitatibacter sp.]
MKKVFFPLLMAATMANAQEDPYLWLEEVTGEKSIAWVKEQNARSQPLLESTATYKELNDRFLAIYTSRERIPNVVKRGDYLYNYWQDATYPRGILRRTSMAEYRKKDPAWETVLDITRLSAEEKQPWVYKGQTCLYPDYKRCLVSLSRGGADAVEVREFDTVAKEFVKDGFLAPESKGGVAWRDSDTIYLSRDFGPGTMTQSGYPRQVRQWKRGTPLVEAKLLYEAREDDVGAGAAVVNEPGRKYELIQRVISTRYGEDFIRQGDKWVMLETPKDADVSVFNGMLVARLRSDWAMGGRTYKVGSLISTDLDEFLAGGRQFDVVFEPAPRVSLQAYAVTRNYLLLDVLDNVKGRVIEARRDAAQWKLREVKVPPVASIGLAALDRDQGDEYLMTVTSFLAPTTLFLARAGADEREKLKSLPAFFDAKGLKVAQYEATSRDGTKVPYFVVMREDARLDGKNPTILYGYGGFEIPMTPNYSALTGSAWLEKGGAYALANLRGGGEFGPEWHQTARREGRQKTHDDFIAVGEDLIKRGVTSPRHLGIYGGSQGGLLVGAALTQRPEIFRAAVSTVPLLDMKRYHKLLAGASWIGEYGNPDEPKDWEFISKYSPYQNVRKDKKYPKVFFATTTRDDRVHPGHARKMVARMMEQGHDVLYFENIEGGHGSGVTPAQQAQFNALIYTFFRKELF